MPYARLIAGGVQISLGTDGAQSNNTLDLLRDLKIGVLIQKQQERNPAFFPVSDAIRLVTIAGAQALGLGELIGSLKAGKQADLIALDIQQPHLQPLHTDSVKMLYTALVYCATGKDVSDTMVQGRWLMRDKKILSLDAPSILKRTNDISLLLRRQAGLAMQ
jgi:5-methylthioadenosine/S-adenosylhomocysteine deaminase